MNASCQLTGFFVTLCYCVCVTHIADCPQRTFFTFSSFLILFSVRFFQLVCINIKLVPRILHELFKHHYKDSWKVVWDDSAEKRTELAAEMENEEVKPEFCYDEVKKKSITLWDITTSYAALKVVWSENYLPQYITNVRDARNSVLHSTETEVQLRRFNEIKDVVQKLIYGAGLSLSREFCDDYQKELDTLASCEFPVCCGCLCAVLNLILSQRCRHIQTVKTVVMVNEMFTIANGVNIPTHGQPTSELLSNWNSSPNRCLHNLSERVGAPSVLWLIFQTMLVIFSSYPCLSQHKASWRNSETNRGQND